MNSLHPEDFARYRREFAEVFDKRAGIYPETEFMFMLWMMWQDDVQPMDRFGAITGDYPVKDRATLERAVNHYTEMWNDTIGLLAELQDLDEKGYAARVSALVTAIKKGLGEKALKQAAWNITSFTIQAFVERNRIKVRADTMEKQVSLRVDQFFTRSAEPFSKTVMGSFAATVLAETADNSEYDGEHILRQLIRLCAGLNTVRQGRLLVRQEMGNKGKDAPCRCGSGLKYKDCCLFG